MYISMNVVRSGGDNERSQFDEEDIHEMGVSIGDAIGAAIDQEIVLPDTRQVTIVITL